MAIMREDQSCSKDPYLGAAHHGVAPPLLLSSHFPGSQHLRNLWLPVLANGSINLVNMSRTANLPRRAMQRRNIPRLRAVAGDRPNSIQEEGDHDRVHQADAAHGDIDGSVSQHLGGSGPNSEDDSDNFFPNPPRPFRLAGGTRKYSIMSDESNSDEASDFDVDSDPDTESILDSGYGSSEENPEQ
ncbi:hypothetical protein S40285_10729, partial [Stachybotrys chlorohalonatus IBT 40285]